MFTSILTLVVSVAAADTHPCALEASAVEFHVQELENLENHLGRMYHIMDSEQHMMRQAQNHQRIGDQMMDEVDQMYDQMGLAIDPGLYDEIQRVERRAEYHLNTAEQIFSMMTVQPQELHGLLIEIDAVEFDLNHAVMNLDACETVFGPVN